MVSYTYIAPWQGQTAPRGENFDVNRKALSPYPFVASFKESLILYNFFHLIHDIYSPRAGGIQPPGNKVLMSTETFCHFSHLIIVDNSF